MAGSTNILQWNPSQANQENDPQYVADAQRLSGATSGAIFDDPTANKLFYQLTSMCAGLAQALANKGFNVSDANYGQLVAVLSNILTTADQQSSLLGLNYSQSLTFDANVARGWDVTLTGNVTSTALINIAPGQQYTFVFAQDGTGGRTVAAPPAMSAVWVQPFPNANAVSVMRYIVRSNNSIHPLNGETVS